MSIQLIQQYYSNVEKLIRYGGTRNESSLRKAFQELLDHYARSKNLVLVPEVGVMGKRGRTVHPDGTLKDALRQDWGYWESKDEKDTLEDEIRTKFGKGYPDFNILFEDTHTAVLIQGGNEILRAEFNDATALDALLTRFVSYEPTEVREFHKAIELFSAEVGGLAEALRVVISEQVSENSAFRQALDEFLELAKKAINPKIEMADVREMIIQQTRPSKADRPSKKVSRQASGSTPPPSRSPSAQMSSSRSKVVITPEIKSRSPKTRRLE